MQYLPETNLPPVTPAGQTGYLGPQGTYSEEVILSLYQEQSETRKFVPFKNINAAIKAAAAGQVEESIIPIENSLEGSVNITLDTLAHEVDLPIIKEVVWPISHYLLARGTNQIIEEIISHPQALAQCRRYLEKNYPRATLTEVDSTSEAVRLVAGGKKNAAAIGSARAGQIYNLDTLASCIEDDKNNTTRFVAVGSRPAAIPRGVRAKTSILCQVKDNRPGSLCAILEEFARRGVNLTHIESRPMRTGLGQYMFFLDMEGSLADTNVREAVAAVRQRSVMFKNLGSYPVVRRFPPAGNDTPAGGKVNLSIAETFAEKPQISNEAKISLFSTLFIGRDDVYARRWENKNGKTGYAPVCKNEWLKGVCNKKQVKCHDCSYRDFQKVDDSVLKAHLQGKEVIGTYAMLQDETCKFLAMDFDDGDWQKDVTVVREVCEKIGVYPAVERSRSGEGAHVWFFFSENISCYTARKFGSSILTYAMNQRHEIKFSSYDKFFPNQDTMPKGGLGNLIALPLQLEARQKGNSVFVDENFVEYANQWIFLNGIRRLNLSQIEGFIKALALTGDLGPLQHEYTSEDEPSPWESKKKIDFRISGKDFPKAVSIIKANMLYIPKKGISSAGLNQLKRLAAFKNPDFYKSQAMRLSTYHKPRIISIADETEDYLILPRGLFRQVTELLNEGSVSKIKIIEKTNQGKKIDASFNGRLREDQELAIEPFLANDIGVLSATTAFGKTVIAAKLIAERKTNTLILVHRTQLLQQWQEKLAEFLTINNLPLEELTPKGGKRKNNGSIIGRLGGGKNNTNGFLDIAVMQSLVKKGEVRDIVKNYGMIIVDECHHVSAFSFEQILKFANAKYVYGLTATPARQDGHHPIIFMHCGEILYKVDAKKQAEKRPFEHVVIPRFTSLGQPLGMENKWEITDCYAQIQKHEMRNNLILEDVLKNITEGRNPIILTERTEHVELLAELLRSNGVKNIVTLVGGNSGKQKRESLQKIDRNDSEKNMVIIATGKYVGEGFDLPRLDTLFLAMPISWKGTLSQYAGRLHRLYEGKNEVRVYDYVDIKVPMLEKMYQKRLKGYSSIGYKTKSDSLPKAESNIIFNRTNFESVYHSDLLTAKEEITIVSPFLSKSRIKSVLPTLKEILQSKVHLKIITRPSSDYQEANGLKISECLHILEEIGVKIVPKSKIHQKFAVIDHKISWYGSINLLSYGVSEESIMRLESTGIALELENLIDFS